MAQFNQSKSRILNGLLFSGERSIFSFLHGVSPPYLYTLKCSYVDVYMKWKRDSYYELIESIHKSFELKPLMALKNCIARNPNGCIPVSDVSKKGLELGIPMKVARFLRQYPSVFEEYTGPNYNLPWFRLTQEAFALDREEQAVYEERKLDITDRLKKLILMSREKRLPLRVIQGMQWYLGLPDGFLQDVEANLDRSFRFVEMEDGMKGLAVECEDKVLSLMQRNAIRRGVCDEGSIAAIEFPLFPSKGLRLRTKIANWIDEFQKLPYVSPYENFSHLDPNSDISEKRIVGVTHELLSLFVEHSAERKKLLCLRKHLGLPQKFHKVFERHPHMFYLSFRNKTCTAILKEAYNDKLAIKSHPLAKVRRKYIKLMQESKVILKKKGLKNCSVGLENLDLKLDLDSIDGNTSKNAEISL